MSDLDDVSSGISTWLIRSPSKRGCLLTSFFEKPQLSGISHLPSALVKVF